MIVERFWAYFDSDTSAAAIQGLMARFLVVQSLFSLLLGLIGAKTFCSSPAEATLPNLQARPCPPPRFLLPLGNHQFALGLIVNQTAVFFTDFARQRCR